MKGKMYQTLTTPLTLGALFGTGLILDEKTLLPFGTFLAISAMVWWLGRKLQTLEDGQKNMKEQLNKLPCCGGSRKNGCDQ